jgi:hypothetical protein
MPFVLATYDVGLILYTGFIDNHVFSIPNKLYEYYVCGLNVLYPPEIKSIRSFKTNVAKPWLREMNFLEPHLPGAEDARRVVSIAKTDLAAEPFYDRLFAEMLRM